MINYVVGFVFESPNRVLLVRKKKPSFMAGKYNGIGGEIEPDEIPILAMMREAREEIQDDLKKAQIHHHMWTEFACVRRPSACIYCFSISNEAITALADEQENDIGEMMSVVSWNAPAAIEQMFDDVHFLLQLAALNPTWPVDIYLEDL